MKIALLILFSLLLSAPAFSQGQWIRQQTPVTSTLTHIVFIDTLNGWAAGDSGKIIHTTNGGTNWQVQVVHNDLPFDDLFFINDSTGWALANDYILGTYIFSTTDAGSNWNFSRFPDDTHFYSTIFFNTLNSGFLAGNEGRILKTFDGGNNWSQCSVDSSLYYRYPIKKLKFFNDRIGSATGGAFDIAGVIWQTTNGGLNWKAYGVGGEPIFKVKYKDSLNILAVGGDHEFGASQVLSTNGGSVWNYSLLNIFGTGYSIEFRNPSDYWIALGFSQNLAHSTNAGVNWTAFSSPDSTALFDMIFKTSRSGWCCGEKGRIYKFNYDYVGINNLSSFVPEGFFLSQNFPNPFNPSTKIKFSLPASGFVKLEVYNVLGKKVKSLADENLKAGSYEVTFDASELSSGVYYYTLQSGNFIQTKKMLLLK